MAEQRERMSALQVTATLSGAVCAHRPLHLDGLLAYAVVLRDEMPMALTAEECVPIEVPLAKEPAERFHLASIGFCNVERNELRYTNRRPPLEQYQTLGNDKIRTCKLSGGPNKGYRIPAELRHLEEDQIRWFCVGDEGELRALLSFITHIGKRRAVGWGQVTSWSVGHCATWDGFPVVRGGQALRHLPLDWPGLRDPAQGFGSLTYPYWDHLRDELCAVPRHH